VGTRTIVDVLDSTRKLYQAKQKLSEARYNYILSILSLKQAAGILEQKDLEEVNQGLMPAAGYQEVLSQAHTMKKATPGSPFSSLFAAGSAWSGPARQRPCHRPGSPIKNPALAGFYYPRSRMVLMMSLVEQPSSKFSTRTSPPLAVTSA
jgi:hypothetical protein